jgi:hypothetical protein
MTAEMLVSSAVGRVLAEARAAARLEMIKRATVFTGGGAPRTPTSWSRASTPASALLASGRHSPIDTAAPPLETLFARSRADSFLANAQNRGSGMGAGAAAAAEAANVS